MKIKFLCEECGRVFCKNVSKEKILTEPSLYEKYGIITINEKVECKCGSKNTFPVSVKRAWWGSDKIIREPVYRLFKGLKFTEGIKYWADKKGQKKNEN